MSVLKTKEDRVRETVEILTKLRQLGIAPTEPGFIETKRHMDEWIATGESAAYKYLFPFYARRCELVLTRKKVQPATFHFFPPEK